MHDSPAVRESELLIQNACQQLATPSECLTEHLQADVERDRDALSDLTDQYEVSGAVLRNLLAAQTDLRRAVMSIAAASAAAAAAPTEAQS